MYAVTWLRVLATCHMRWLRVPAEFSCLRHPSLSPSAFRVGGMSWSGLRRAGPASCFTRTSHLVWAAATTRPLCACNFAFLPTATYCFPRFPAAASGTKLLSPLRALCASH